MIGNAEFIVIEDSMDEQLFRGLFGERIRENSVGSLLFSGDGDDIVMMRAVDFYQPPSMLDRNFDIISVSSDSESESSDVISISSEETSSIISVSSSSTVEMEDASNYGK